MSKPIVERSRAVLPGLSEIVLAGGCFWGTQAYLDALFGVEYTDVGYANGEGEQPSYEQVCSGQTGFAESVRVVYDPRKIVLGFLLRAYFESIDPTSINRQGNDTGSQYRTGIYYLDDADQAIIEAELAALAKKYTSPIEVEAMPLNNYYLAESYHQEYLKKNPGGYCHIPPKAIERAKTLRAFEKPADDVLRARLSERQYNVTQNAATEPPFQNEYHDHFEPGIYVDITTGQPLFSSADKFESGCGWPAFAKPIDERDVERRADDSLGMRRTEVRAENSRSHLGHVFADGPAERGGLRYCINSAALRFVPKSEMENQGYGYLLGALEL